MSSSSPSSTRLRRPSEQEIFSLESDDRLATKLGLAIMVTISLSLIILVSGGCGPNSRDERSGAFQSIDALPGSDIDASVLGSRAARPTFKNENEIRVASANPSPTPETAVPLQASRGESVRTGVTASASLPSTAASGAVTHSVSTSLLSVPNPVVNPAAAATVPRSQAGLPSTNGFFDLKGRPLKNYDVKLRERFGNRLNTPVTASQISREQLLKSQKIFREIQRAVDRSHDFDHKLMFVDANLAQAQSKAFETMGTLASEGAWTIAVEATSKRHGFGNVPCAEFMSEVIRQAYRRAGYALTPDFNSNRQNSLIWTGTASVSGLSRALYKAGWVPFSAQSFRPPIGAIMMHTTGQSPSHTFAAAGFDGQMVVDNGSPKGRDLRQTKTSIVNLMFSPGFFMLPPGITPQSWADSN